MEGDELETVQYKFASIIGGLCGKPKIMSQFAVWLDLRLAEYKLKGAISLDCSGCRPDPDWLNGIKPDFTSLEQERFIVRETISQESHIPQEGVNTVIIKQEDTDRSERLMCNQNDIYPIALHDFNKHIPSRSSPHSSPENLSKSTPSTSHSFSSQAKIRKISDVNFPACANNQNKRHELSDTEISPLNESLISLISSEQEAIVLEEDSNTESRLLDRSSDPTDRLQESPSSSHFPEAWSLPINHRIPMASQDGEWPLSTVQSLLQANSQFSGISKDRFIIRKRIKNFEQKPVKTVRNVVAAVRCFELWLWYRFGGAPHNEKRQVFEIPPPELDMYLVQFFQEVKKPDGGDFHHESFRCIRSRLASYLLDNDYPVSIVNSSEFSNSIQSFKDRLALLKSTEIANKNNDSRVDLQS